MAKVANIDPFKNFPGWNPVEKHKNHGQNQKASHMEPFGGNLWHCDAPIDLVLSYHISMLCFHFSKS